MIGFWHNVLKGEEMEETTEKSPVDTRWVLDFYGPKAKMFDLAETIRTWAENSNQEFSFTDMPDNEYGLPVIALVPKKVSLK